MSVENSLCHKPHTIFLFWKIHSKNLICCRHVFIRFELMMILGETFFHPKILKNLENFFFKKKDIKHPLWEKMNIYNEVFCLFQIEQKKIIRMNEWMKNLRKTWEKGFFLPPFANYLLIYFISFYWLLLITLLFVGPHRIYNFFFQHAKRE